MEDSETTGDTMRRMLFYSTGLLFSRKSLPLNFLGRLTLYQVVGLH